MGFSSVVRPAAVADQAGAAVDKAAGAAHDAATSRWFRRLVRLGFVGTGLLYLMVGLLAAMAAAGEGGEITDPRGALAIVASKPMGLVGVAIAALGFAGHALWHLARAVLDLDREGTGAKAVAMRVGHGALAVLLGSLTVGTVGLILGRNDGSDEQALSARLLALPAGPLLVGAVGAGIVALGIGHLVWAARGHFARKLDLSSCPRALASWIHRLGRFGFAARGVVFLLVGGFVVRAAASENPREVRGLDGALRELAGQPWGTWLLGATALGLAAFGAYTLASARYRRLPR